MPGQPIYSEVDWRGNSVLLVGTTHGAHTHHEMIVNKLEEFNPSVVFVEGNMVGEKAVEHRSARNYSKISNATVKPLASINQPHFKDDYRSSEDVEEDEFKKGPIDARKVGRLGAKASRYIVKIMSEDAYQSLLNEREQVMVQKIMYELERNNSNRVAVIFGKAHVIGIEKLLSQYS